MTKKQEESFAELPWHDAVLLRLTIDRRVPGERDELVLLIEWIDGRKQEVRFTDCYAMEAQMNFGVIAPESILEAECRSHTLKLAEIRQRWSTLNAHLEDLLSFEFTMNSTASVIRIFARQFDIVDLTEERNVSIHLKPED